MKTLKVPVLPACPEDDARVDALCAERSKKAGYPPWCSTCRHRGADLKNSWDLERARHQVTSENFVQAANDANEWARMYHEEINQSLLRTVLGHMGRTVSMILTHLKGTRWGGLVVASLSLASLLGVATLSGGCSAQSRKSVPPAYSRSSLPPLKVYGPCPSMGLDLEYEEKLLGVSPGPMSMGEEEPSDG